MEISFGMIFSIILIAIFLFVGFFAIRMFLNLSDKVNVASFIKELQNEVDTLHGSIGGSDGITVRLNTDGKLTHVCFMDRERDLSGSSQNIEIGRELSRFGGERSNNMYFYPSNVANAVSTKIERINMTAFQTNPHCIEAVNNRINVVLAKNTGEALVRIK